MQVGFPEDHLRLQVGLRIGVAVINTYMLASVRQVLTKPSPYSISLKLGTFDSSSLISFDCRLCLSIVPSQCSALDNHQLMIYDVICMYGNGH